MAVTWRLHGGYMAAPWTEAGHTHVRSIARRLHGGYMAVTWRHLGQRQAILMCDRSSDSLDQADEVEGGGGTSLRVNVRA